MSESDAKADLQRYLQFGREAVVWKLDGLTDYDIRRPLTPTGTNLVGLIKHLSIGEARYLGDVFGRPFPERLPWWDDDAEPNSDMWATVAESRQDIVGLYHRSWAHADATIEALPLDAVGRVPWWSGGGQVTLHRVLVHVTAETHRHAGHADIVREVIDGTAGLRADYDNLAVGDRAWWAAYRDRLEGVARAAAPPRP